MKFGYFKDLSQSKRLLIWLGLTIVYFLIVLGLLASGSSMLIANGMDIQQPHAMRWLLVYQDVFIFILPSVLTVCYWSSTPGQWLHINQPTHSPLALYAILLMIVALPGNNLLAWINQQIVLPDGLSALEQWMRQQEDASQAVLDRLMADSRLGNFLLNLTVMAILAAISEELLFRGVLQGVMKHTQAAIWITAIIFSAIHMQFYGFIPRMLMGALFGYMLVWSKNLWLPVLMHCTNNAAICILYYIAQVHDIDTKSMDTFGTGDTLWIGIVSLIAVIAGIYFLRRSLTMSNASSRTSKGN
ncbi:MAG: CPBP family intramembrane metalloprotease [Paludibacteraceae bacterium]|nr:CPBP family intramembrane metalloprotease [Paludibacteraceae bacterium]